MSGPSAKTFALGAVVVAAVGLALRFAGVTFGAPHEILPTPAGLTGRAGADLDRALAERSPRDRTAAVAFALDYTARRLRFGLGHPTSLDFSRVPRQGNCVEYAYLFAAAFNAAAARAHLTARAFRVHSDAARVFGMALPLRGWTDHDWTLVVDPADGTRLYLDPTLYDAWLGPWAATNVRDKGAIRLP